MKLEFAIERIDLSVNEQSMRLLGNNELVANSVNYVYAHFRFPDEWKDLTKQVHFKQALPTAIHLILFLDGNNSVLVPHEVLDHKGEFTVHLVGTGNGVTITTNPLTVYIRDNGLLTPDNNATPTPDFLIESVARVKEDRDAVEADREHVDELAEQLPQIIAESIVPAAEKAANEVKESIISTVQETADSAVETVNTAKDNAISTITTTSESAVNSVTVIKTTSLNAIENARGEVMEELGELVGQATSEADRATTKATEANASAVLAGEHETSARGYSTSAGASATTATTKANEAKGYAESASADASSVAAWNNKVYVGNTAPSESNVSIWINPDEDDPPDIVEQVNQQSDDIVDLQKENAEQQRQINFLKDMTEGIAWRKETDTEEAYTKQIPKGAKGVAINSIGGKNIVEDGELITIACDSVEVRGANLFNSELVTDGYINDVNGNVGGTTSKGNKSTDYIEIEPSTKYWIISQMTTGNWGAWYDADKKYISGLTNYSIAKTSPANARYCRFTVNYNNNPNYANTTAFLKSNSNTVPNYIPYTEQTIPIPSSIQQLEGYGWSAGTVYNEVDFENKKFIQRVGLPIVDNQYTVLATPIETDITDLLADFDNSTECEGNGSITFKNSTEYKVPIPNELEYIVKVSEAL